MKYFSGSLKEGPPVRQARTAKICGICIGLIPSEHKYVDFGNRNYAHLYCAGKNRYGILGGLTQDSVGNIQCHICGFWWIHLGQHVAKTHHWQPEDYRETFGLNRLTALCNEDYSIARAVIAKRNQDAGLFPSGKEGAVILSHPPAGDRPRWKARLEERRLRSFLLTINNPSFRPEVRAKISRKAKERYSRIRQLTSKDEEKHE